MVDGDGAAGPGDATGWSSERRRPDGGGLPDDRLARPSRCALGSRVAGNLIQSRWLIIHSVGSGAPCGTKMNGNLSSSNERESEGMARYFAGYVIQTNTQKRAWQAQSVRGALGCPGGAASRGLRCHHPVAAPSPDWWHLQLPRLPDGPPPARCHRADAAVSRLAGKTLAWIVRFASLAAKPPWRSSPPGPGTGGRPWPMHRPPPKGALP